jgi:hypothetical protein
MGRTAAAKAAAAMMLAPSLVAMSVRIGVKSAYFLL